MQRLLTAALWRYRCFPSLQSSFASCPDAPAPVRKISTGQRSRGHPVQDRNAALVAVAICTTSARQTKAGQDGFAHLFEHMMFTGSKQHCARVSEKLLEASAVPTPTRPHRSNRTNYFDPSRPTSSSSRSGRHADRMGTCRSRPRRYNRRTIRGTTAPVVRESTPADVHRRQERVEQVAHAIGVRPARELELVGRTVSK